MAREQKFISAVAAVDGYSEELEDFLRIISGVLSERFQQAELILVLTTGQERNSGVIKEYFKNNPTGLMISIVTLDPGTGLEMAMNAGRDLAIGDYIYEFDDIHVDYTPVVISETYDRCIADGLDIVTARNDRPVKFSSRVFYRVYNALAGAGKDLGPSSFRILSRRAVNRIKSLGVYIPYRKAVYRNAGLQEASFVYGSTDTTGKSRHTVKKERGDLAIDSFIYFTDLMEKVSIAICLIFFAIAVGVIIYILVSLFTDEKLMSGWVSIMGFLSIGFTGLFGLITIVIKYLSVLVNLSFSRQQYLIRDIEKISGV